MEDHVGRLLRAFLALFFAGLSLAAFRFALSPGAAGAPAAAAPSFALLAVLLGLAAFVLGRAAAPDPGFRRSAGLAAAVAGLLVALVLLGEAAFVVGRAFLENGPDTRL